MGQERTNAVNRWWTGGTVSVFTSAKSIKAGWLAIITLCTPQDFLESWSSLFFFLKKRVVASYTGSAAAAGQRPPQGQSFYSSIHGATVLLHKDTVVQSFPADISQLSLPK